MISLPEKLQLQISDALAVMAAEDFPDNWDNLIQVCALPSVDYTGWKTRADAAFCIKELISHFSPTDYRVNNGILQIAHSIFKR